MIVDDTGVVRGTQFEGMQVTVSAGDTGLAGWTIDPRIKAVTRADSLADGEILVEWLPVTHTGGAKSLQYRIRYRATDESDWSYWTSGAVQHPDSVSLTCGGTLDALVRFDCETTYKAQLTDLDSTKEYEVEIQARNVNGYGPWRVAAPK